jgi:hypothetical protein|tara:strand:- start:2308 stop:2475 length:168 start_codon:yes stop_codon:yes gene_type:complete
MRSSLAGSVEYVNSIILVYDQIPLSQPVEVEGSEAGTGPNGSALPSYRVLFVDPN